LAHGCGEKIKIDEIGKYIKVALGQYDDECPKIACGVLSDLAMTTDTLNEYLEDFVPCLHAILQNQQIDRKFKISAINALG
jgi:hypothetical protein